MKTMILS